MPAMSVVLNVSRGRGKGGEREEGEE